MSEIHWTKHVNGNFGTASDWTGHAVPGAGDDAILNAAGTSAYFVAATTTETVASLQTNAMATLSVRVGAGAGGFNATGGSGSGANAGTIDVFDGGDFNFGGTIDNTGKLELASTGDATQLNISAAATLSGAGKVSLSDNANNQIAATAAATLTNVNNTLSGAGTIGGGGLTLDNEAAGVIDASGAKAALVLNTGANIITNAGVIEATGAGGLVIDSTIHNAGGSIEVLDGSTLSFNDGAVISGGTLLAGAGTHLVLTSAALKSVTLKTQGTGTIQLSGGSLTGVINQANISVAAGTDLFVAGALNNAGTISLVDNNNGGENGTQIVLTGSTVLEGGGRIVMGGTTPWNDYINAQSNGLTLTNLNETIEGAGNIGGGLGDGTLKLVNDAKGVIAADYANQLVINPGGGTVTNYGVLEGIGKGGLAIDANVDNLAGGKISAGNGSLVDLNGVTVTGGVLTTAGTGAIDAQGSATLVNVDNKGTLSVQDGDAFTLAGTLTNSGDVKLAGANHGGNLFISGSVTLTGAGQVTLGGATPWNNDIGGTASGQTLVNVNNTISCAGTIGGNNLNVINDAAGVIDASDASTALTLDSGSPTATFTNKGLIEGTGAAGLAITSTSIKNAGGTILAANGSQVALNGATLAGGTVESVGSGVVNVTSATFTNVTDKANVALGDGSAIYLSTTLANSGVITVEGGGHGGNIFVASKSLYLSGGGTMNLGGSTPWNNDVSGTASGDTLFNIDNTITGAGNVGGNGLAVVNEAAGVVDANNAAGNALTFNDGGAVVVNKGLMEATAGGNFTLSGTSIQNAGGTILAATGSQVALNNNANITGGTVETAGTGVIDIEGGNSFSGLTVAGNVSVLDGDALNLGGAVKNNGVITVQGGGHGGGLAISGAVTLSGSGSVAIGGASPWNSAIYAGGSGAVLTNDSTIVGQGHMKVALVNGASGVIDGKPGADDLYLDNTGAAVANSGLLEATNGGTLVINDAVTNGGAGKIEASSGAVNVFATISNAGLMEANGTGTLTIEGGAAVTETGSGTLESHGGTVVVNGGVTGGLAVDGGVMDLTQSGVTNNVTFLGGGQLKLNQSQSYTGSVSGFSKTGTNSLDLTDIGFVSASEASFVENKAGTSGVLTVTNGSATAEITLIGNYSASTFTTSKDSSGGTKVVATSSGAGGGVPVHAFIGAMAAFGADAGAAVSTPIQPLHTDHPLLAATGR